MIGFGVLAGASMLCQLVISNPGNPDSAIVGISGTMRERRGVVTASPRSFPALICGSAGGSPAIIICTWPAITAAIAGPVPLYGTCTICNPAADLKSSLARWFGVPAPPDAKLNAPGFALTTAMSSFTDCAGTEG